MKGRVVKRLLLLSVIGLWLWGAVGVEGPWRAQVVDAETGKPLEGVVVVVGWTKFYRSVGGWAGPEHYTSEEVVTGSDGRFTISRHWTFAPLVFFSTIKRSEFVIFKPGYGRFQFRDMKGWEERDSFERQARADDISRRFFRGEEFVLELPLLKTQKERREFIISGPPSLVPNEEAPRLMEALRDYHR